MYQLKCYCCKLLLPNLFLKEERKEENQTALLQHELRTVTDTPVSTPLPGTHSPGFKLAHLQLIRNYRTKHHISQPLSQPHCPVSPMEKDSILCVLTYLDSCIYSDLPVFPFELPVPWLFPTFPWIPSVPQTCHLTCSPTPDNSKKSAIVISAFPKSLLYSYSPAVVCLIFFQ